MPSILIISAGHEMCGDDAIGPMVTRRLSTMTLDDVEILDLSTAPLDLLDHLAGRRALGIIDAVVADDMSAGQVVECDWSDPARPRIASDRSVSTHGMGLKTALDLARSMGTLPPRVTLFGIVIASTELGRQPGPAVIASIPLLADRVATWARVLRAAHEAP